MLELIGLGEDLLAKGESAIEAVTAVVEAMERSGLYVAGKGSAPNKDGTVELDASIMSGKDRRAGAVAALRNVASPIAAARKVMEDGRHVMLGGEGATSFALERGLEGIDNPGAYYSDFPRHMTAAESHLHGTVGAVALDQRGELAAATSTGGLFGKLPGRIGDTPLIGSGSWADDLVAVSCTGHGEYFIRTNAAHDLSARMRYGGATLETAAQAVLDDIAGLGGDGGLIAVDRTGRIVMPYNSQGMKRAAVVSGQEPVVQIFEPC
jgi:isoaspartyl peptidase/L-asparaginase-like protein (Ntn-hydrolase superfamily)